MRYTTLTRMLKNQSEVIPDKTAIIFRNRKIDYRTLNERANQIAHALKDNGISPQDNVAILLKNSPDYIFSYFAILKTGAIVIPLNIFLKADELKYILNDCGVKVIITEVSFMEELNKFLPEIPSLKSVILKEKNSKFQNLEEIYNVNSRTEIDEKYFKEDTAVIIYTSGTTGHPKGAMLSHQNILSNIEGGLKAVSLKESDRILDILPMFHSFTFTVCILLPLYLGITIIVVESVRPFSNVLKAIFKHRSTILVGIPNLYQILSQSKIPGFLLWFNPIRLCVSGGAPLPPIVLEKFEKKFKVPLLEGYGLSEASPVVSIMPENKNRRPGSVGTSLPGVEVKIIDENENELPFDEVGELVVRGPNVMQGYLNQPGETEKILNNGWLYTGDLAKIDKDNYIYIVDRKKDMILSHGMNIYPRELEDLLYTHPKVAECAIVGIKDNNMREIPTAFIVFKKGQTASIDELHQFFRGKVAAYKIPHFFEFISELPKTSTGKILKRALRNSATTEKETNK